MVEGTEGEEEVGKERVSGSQKMCNIPRPQRETESQGALTISCHY